MMLTDETSTIADIDAGEGLCMPLTTAAASKNSSCLQEGGAFDGRLLDESARLMVREKWRI